MALINVDFSSRGDARVLIGSWCVLEGVIDFSFHQTQICPFGQGCITILASVALDKAMLEIASRQICDAMPMRRVRFVID